MKNTKIAGLLFIFITVLTAFQGFIPSIPGINEQSVTMLSAITLYLVSTLTLFRQTISNEIDNTAKNATWVVVIIATIGGLNDILNIVHFSETVDQWLRFAITFTTFILNLISKLLWPTPETKSII